MAGRETLVITLLTFTEVVRTSATVVTVTLPVFATYDIAAVETVTVTVPATALTGGGAVVATPTFDVLVATPIAQVQKATGAGMAPDPTKKLTARLR